MPKGSIKSSLWLVGAGLSVLVVGYYLAAIMVPQADKADPQYQSRLSLSKAEIQALSSAVEIFHQRYGHYPTTLDDLVHPPPGAADDHPIVSRLVPDPWGNPIHYQSLETGNGFNLWVVPDETTRQRTGQTVLSNTTDWTKIAP